MADSSARGLQVAAALSRAGHPGSKAGAVAPCSRGSLMFTLRCTARLRKRLGTTEETTSTPPSTKLGDWYAQLLLTRPQLVLCVSERTLLPVVIAARDGSRLVPRLREAVGQMLRVLAVAE